MCLEKVETIMTEYELIKEKIKKMNDKTLQLTLIIIDNAEGVSHEDFFEIAKLLLIIDNKEEHENRKIIWNNW